MPAIKGSAAAAVTSANNVATPTTLTPTLPAHATGDTLLCYTACRSATPTVATPSGWTQLLNVTGTNGRLVLFGKIAASGSETAPSVVWSGLTTGTSGTPVQAQCAVFTGMLGTMTGLVDVTGTVEDGAASTTVSASGAAVTTATDFDLVLSLTTRLDDAGTFTQPSGFTMIGQAGSTSGADFATAWAFLVKTPAGSVAPADFSLASAVSFASSGVLVALKGSTPVSASDTNGTVTESASVAVLIPPAGIVLDDFNRANSLSPGGGWLGAGAGGSALQINGNRLAHTGGVADDRMYWNAPPVADQDVWIEMPLAIGAANDQYTLGARCSADFQNGYFLQASNAVGSNAWSFLLYKLVAGGSTVLGNLGLKTLASSGSDAIGLTVRGTEVQAWVRLSGSWQSMATVTDASVTAAGYATFQSHAASPPASATLDNFSGNIVGFPLMSSLADDFNRPDSTNLGANWVNQSRTGGDGFQIVGNRLKTMIDGSWDGVHWNSVAADQECYVTVPVISAMSSTWQLWVRRDPVADTGYFVAIPNGGGPVQLYRRVTGADTALGGFSTMPVNAGDAIGLQVSGSTITLFRKPSGGSWGVVSQRTDTTITAAGRCAIWANNSVWQFDDWGAQPLAPASTPVSGSDSGTASSEVAVPTVQIADTSPINEIETGTLAAQIPTPVAYRSAVLTDSPIAYWRLGDAGATAKDEMGAYNGTYQGSYAHTAGALVGDSDTAAKLDGSGAYITVPLADLNGSPLTCEAWVKFNATITSFQMILAAYDASGAPYPGWGFCYQASAPSNRQIEFYSSVWGGWVQSTTLITDGNYHHVAVTVTAGGVVRFYIDGVPAGTASSQPPGSYTGTKAIGANVAALDAGLMPAVDEVAVYSYALTPTQIAAHYQAGTGGYGGDVGASSESASVAVPSTPVASSDSNGATIEAVGALKAVITDTSPINETETILLGAVLADTSPINETESASGTALVSGSDTSGTTTEATTTAAPVSASDSGTAAEATVTTTAAPAADAGAGAEASALVAQVPAADANASTETAATGTIPVGSTDTSGATTESASITKIAMSASDAGTDAEAAAYTFPFTATDAATDSESTAGTAQVPATDTSAATDAILRTGISASDANLLTEAATPVATGLVATDASGVTSELGALGTVTPVNASDTNSTAAEATALVAPASSSDTSGTATEAQAAGAQLPGADASSPAAENAALGTITPVTGTDANGASSEATATVAKLPGTDANVTVETTATVLPAADTGSGADSVGAAKFTASDVNAATTETGGLGTITPVSAADTITTAESASATRALVSSTDQGGAAESASEAAVSGSAETILTVESAVPRVLLAGSDTGGAVEVAAPRVSRSVADAGLTAEQASYVEITGAVLNVADAVMLGGQPVDAVYCGEVLVWTK